MFAPLAKWAARIDDAARIPEYLARAYAVAINGRPGPVVLALPEDMLLDEVEAVDRPRIYRTDTIPEPDAVDVAINLLRQAERPVVIAGGGPMGMAAKVRLARWAAAAGVPVAAAFRRQDAIGNRAATYAGNLGYGPNPALVRRVREADLLLVIGARLGEATTDGYTLVTPDHPGQRLIHVHADPNELDRVYRSDLAIAASADAFLRALEDGWAALPDRPAPRPEGAAAHADYRAWTDEAAPSMAALDLGQVVLTMRDRLRSGSFLCNGAGNYSGWWHRYWRYDEARHRQLAPTAGAMGYGVPAAIAAALRHPNRQAIALAGDGCFLMNGQELATAVQHGASILVIVVDNSTYGTIRMHQEREFPGRESATRLHNPDFAALGRAFGAYAETVERTEEFAPALERALEQPGVKLLHLKTDIEQITNGTTLSAIRDRPRP